MDYSRPAVLSIAGLDPSGGAGLLADIKTFEQHRCLGFGVASAITAQTEDRFFHIDWLPLNAILQQCAPLLEQYRVHVIKIGIMEDIDTLLELVFWLKTKRSTIRIVWDPVLSSTSGYRFITNTDQEKLQELLRQIDLVTPNRQEALRLGNATQAKDAALWMAQFCSVLLKGGHAEAEKGIDYLYHQQGEFALQPTRNDLYPKHGSGCILSSAIAAQLALGASLEQACIKAKTYIETLLNSNQQLLAYHYV